MATKDTNQQWLTLNRRIRAAEKAAGMTRDDHQALVARVTGKDSLKNCNAAELFAVLKEVEGGKPAGAFKPASKPYVRKVWALWGELVKLGEIRADDKRAALVAYVNRMLGTEYGKPGQLDWMSTAEADKVIRPLKEWIARTALAQEEADRVAV